MLSQYFRRGFKVKWTAVFIFVHHPHILADLRCVCWPLICRSVSWFITTSDMIVRAEYSYNTVCESLRYVIGCWRKMLWLETSNLMWLCWEKNCNSNFKRHELKTPCLKTFFFEFGIGYKNSLAFCQIWSNFLWFPVQTLNLDVDIFHWNLILQHFGLQILIF